MNKVGAGTFAALACAAGLGAAGSHAAGVATGDSCVATGNGTAYTLNITIPSTAPQQFGFAFGARGTAVTNAVVPGTQGTFSTQRLPSGSSGAWISETPLQPGSATASLTTTGPVQGAFTVMPASASTPTYFEGVPCTMAAGTSMPSTAFSVDRHAIYVPSSRAWHLGVRISGAGTVHASVPEPTVGVGSVMKKTVMPLVESRSIALRSAGKVTLTLRPTARGQKTLAGSGALYVRLEVVFDPRGGKSATKLVSLTLTK
jgi:hypothetical protein